MTKPGDVTRVSATSLVELREPSAPSAGAESRPPTITPSLTLAVALVLAVLTAWMDFGVRLGLQLRPGRPIGMGPDAFWMAPLMNVVWIGVPAFALVLAMRRQPGRVSPALVFGTLSFLALAVVFSMNRRVHWGAELLLALGLAARLGPFLAHRQTTMARWATPTVRFVLIWYVAASAALFAARWGRERWTLSFLPSARDGAPNVLLLVFDTVRSLNTSLYGYDRSTTPHLAQLASQGARFENAYATAPWTLPSHASMFTGRYPQELSADLRTRLDDTYPTLAEVMRGDGYATGSFVANLSYCTWQYGLTRGFIHVDGYPVSAWMLFTSTAIGRRLYLQPWFRRLAGAWQHPGAKPAARVNSEFLQWLDRSRGRPFFAFLNYYDAHHPALPPAPFDTLFGRRPPVRSPDIELAYDSVPPKELAERIAQYDGAIRYMDGQLDLLLRQLRDRGLLDNTIVVVLSDHGEHWGDHERLSHGNSLYRQLLQVPLVLRYPARLQAGTRVVAPVSLRDLPATVLDLAGSPQRDVLPGVSLVGTVAATASVASLALSENPLRGPSRSVSLVRDGLHYLRDSTGREELYDAARDTAEVADIARTARGAAALPRLRASVDSLFASAARRREIARAEP